MHEVLVNHLEGLSLPRKSMVRLTDRPDMTFDVYRGRKTTIQQHIHGAWVANSCIVPFAAFSYSDWKQVPIYCRVDRILKS